MARKVVGLCVVFFLAFVIGGGNVGGQSEGDAPAAQGAEVKTRTGFLPSRDMLQINNPSGGQYAARGGSCHGLIETALYYKMIRDGEAKLREGNPNFRPERPTLAQVTTEIKTKYPAGDLILQGLGMAAQQHAYDQQEYVMKPDTAKRTIFENVKTEIDAGNPARVELRTADGRASHAVILYDYYKDGDGNLRFKVGDPNQPWNDKAEVVWNAQTKKWGDFQAGNFTFKMNAVTTPLERDPVKLITNIDRALAGDNPARDIVPEFKKPVERQAGSSLEDKVFAAFDKVIGGVLIKYPKSWSMAEDNDPRQIELMEKIQKFISENEEGACVFSMSPEKAKVELVSLEKLAASGSKTLGTLTSVRGYVVSESGEIFVAGTVEEGAPAISMDWLTVALKAVWAGGESPFVSLDPDPADFSRPHKVRIGGLPKECESSDFVRVLLEADYLMKKISLGAEKPQVEGFESWFDMLLKDNAARASGIHRDWLSPMTYPSADVFTMEANGGRAVWFEDGVQVMTENLKRARGGLSGTGRTDPTAEAAANEMTRHFAALAKLYPEEFGKLAAVFNLCKLAAVLRSNGIRSKTLETIGTRQTPGGLTRKEYEAIKPRQVGTRSLYVSGGAVTRQRVRAGKMVRAEQLGGMIEAVANGKLALELELPATLKIDPASLKFFNADLHMNAGFARFEEGDYDAALSRLDLALEIDPELDGAYLYRGVSRFSVGRVDEALADIDRVVANEPKTKAFRAVLLACKGDAGGAVRDAELAEKEFGEDTDVLSWCALARYYAGDFANCEKTCAKILQMSPLDREALTISTLLKRMNKLGPAASMERIKLERQVPLSLMEAVGSAYSAIVSLDVVASTEQLERAQKLCIKHEGNSAVKATYLRERVLYQTAMCGQMAAEYMEKLGQAGDADLIRARSAEAAETLVQAHPDWASANIARAVIKPAYGDRDRRMEYLVKAVDLDESKDPLLEEMRETMGTKFARSLCVVGALRESKPKDEKTAMKLMEFIFESTGDKKLIEQFAKLKSYRTTPPPEKLKELCASFYEFWRKNPGDPFAIYMYCAFGTIEAMTTAEKGDEKAFSAALKPLLECLNQNGLPETVMNLSAMTQMVMWMQAGQIYIKKFKEDPGVAGLEEQVRSGMLDGAAMDLVMVKASMAATATVDKSLPASTISAIEGYVRMEMQTLRKKLVGIAEEWARNNPADERKFNLLKLTWNKGDEEAMVMALLNVEGLADFKFETELRSVTFLLDQFEKASAMGAGIDDPAFVKMMDVMSKVRATVDSRSKSLRFARPALDWSAWKPVEIFTPAPTPAPAVASKNVGAAAPTAAQEKAGLPWGMIGVGGGAVAVIGAIVFAMKRRRAA